MTEQITIELSNDTRRAVEALAAAEGLSAATWIVRVLEARVFTQRFRAIREEILRLLDDRGVRLTDEEVFRMLS